MATSKLRFQNRWVLGVVASTALHLLLPQPAAAAFCPYIAFDPTAPGTVLAGFSDFGILRSTDNGSTWRRTSLPGYPLSDLQIDPRNPANVYAGTWNGVMKSTDGGLTWKNSGLGDSSVDAFAINPRTPSVVFARASRLDGVDWSGAVFKSVNGGADWSPANNGLPERGVFPLWYSPDEADVVYAGSNTGLFKTTDGGRNWSAIGTGLPAGRVATAMISTLNSAVVYAAPFAAPGLFKSADGGSTWIDTGAGLPAFGILDLAQAPSRRRLYAATAGDGLYESTDDGTTWKSAGLSSHHLCRIAVTPWDPRTLYVVAGGTTGSTVLFQSTDGGASWTRLRRDLPQIFTFH